MNPRRVTEALLGLYVAWLLVPAAILATGRLDLTVAPLVAGVGIATAVAVGARGVPSLVDRLAGLAPAVVTVSLPLAYFPYMIAVTTPGSRAAAVAATGGVSVLAGIGVPVSAALIRSKRLRERADPVATVTVGTADGTDRRHLAGVVVFVVAVAAVGVFVLVEETAGGGALITAMSGASTALLPLLDGERELAVTDVGLRIDRSVTRWAAFAGYRVTDDAVVLVGERWYRPDRRFDLEGIEDVELLTDALSRYLPRLDDLGRVEVPVRRE